MASLMYSVALFLAVTPIAVGSILRRENNGVAITPAMGWNSYNHYSCNPNETIIRSNAQALVSLGLSKLGYEYVTIDCGWTVPYRVDGSLTWNATLFPDGIPALSAYIHNLGLKFGMYEDGGVLTCGGPPAQAGSLGNETHDAATFVGWEIDALKYDNCYSSAPDYPNVDYTPSVSPSGHYAAMSKALIGTKHPILFQVCDWGVDFPALWAPAYGNSWRISNDVYGEWRSIWRIANQAVPNVAFAGPGNWPDLDMLEVGNNYFTTPEEQTHFTLWAIVKSPLTIGAALKDSFTSIPESSLQILSDEKVISYNQDSLGISANLTRRWTDEQYDVWSGPLSNGRFVAAVVNWANTSRELTLNLPDIGVQYAETVKNIWGGTTHSRVQTSYTGKVEAHGTLLLELENVVVGGTYPANIFATKSRPVTTFKNVYGVTSSQNYGLTITFALPLPKGSKITVKNTYNGQSASTTTTSDRSSTITLLGSLSAGASNVLQITAPGPATINSVRITDPQGTYYPSTSFDLYGGATLESCGSGYCVPVGSKIGYISPTAGANISVTATVPTENSFGSKYVTLDYINNDIALATAWDLGSNSRNITIAVNDGPATRLEVPLSGRHSELFGPGLGWWDSATLGVLTTGWVNGENKVVISNANGQGDVTTWGADFVGLRFFD